MDYSTTEMNFLDVTVMEVGNKLETDLYCKSNDRNQFIHMFMYQVQVHVHSVSS